MKKLTLKDLFIENPRWCPGCGNTNVLTALKRFIVDRDLEPNQIVNVSGIGCSGRMPNYINTFGIHAIHGRPIPVAFGLALAAKDATIFIHSGDGDALSIGGNHLIHGIHRNFNCVFLLYDNQTYALTKNQASPTTPSGWKTVSHPRGVLGEPLNPIRLALGAGAAFVAATADWLSDHLYRTIEAAFEHKGFSFVHILQRCAYYHPEGFDRASADWFSFLVHREGIPEDVQFANQAGRIEHDPGNLTGAFELAGDGRKHFGLYHRRSGKPCQEEVLRDQTEKAMKKPRTGILDAYRLSPGSTR